MSVKNMQKQKGVSILVGIIIIAVATIILFGGVFTYQYYYSAQKQVACTQEAKLCPDGSYVSRSGPDCQFAECPKTADQTFVTKEECEEKTGCKCDFVACDYIPAGKTFEETCGENFKKGWQCR